jgi:general transcription factor IIIA
MAAVQSSPAAMLSPLLREYDAGPSTRSPNPPVAKKARIEVASPPTPVKRVTKSRSRSATPGERRYQCPHEGCDKAYTKPSRLAEHELSHTGEVSYTSPQRMS